MEMSKEKKHRVKIGALLGTSIGIVAASVFWIAGFGPASIALVPVGILIGAGQAYLSRDDTEE